MSDTRFLPKEFLTEFIKRYRQFTCLWKMKSKDYANKNLKNQAYEELAKFCRNTYPESDVQFVKTKIQSLRNSFRKEVKKVYTSRKSGTDNVYEPALWYYNLLLFTNEQHMSEDSIENFDVNVKDESSISFQESEESEQLLEDFKDVPLSPSPTTSNDQEVTESLPKRQKRNAEDEFSITPRSTVNSETFLDEFEIVGKNVATKLRQMDFRQRLLAEGLIQQVLIKGLFNELTRETVVEENETAIQSYSSQPSTSHTPATSFADECKFSDPLA